MANYDGNPFEEQMRMFESATGQGARAPFSRPSFLPNSVRSHVPPPPTFARPTSLASKPSQPKEYAAAPVISKPPVDDHEDVFSTLLKYEKEVRAEKKEKKQFEKAKKLKGNSDIIKSSEKIPLKQPMRTLMTSVQTSASTISAEPVRSAVKLGTQVTPDEIKQKAQQMLDLVKASQVMEETKRLQIPSTRQVGGMGTQTTNWATGKVILTSNSSGSETTTSISGHKQTKKPKKLIRVAGGQTWEDQSLLSWDVNDFRLFCGDLGNDVTDEVLTRTFSRIR